MDFLALFGDVLLYPVSVEANGMDSPFTVIMVATLIGLGFVRLLRRLLCI